MPLKLTIDAISPAIGTLIGRHGTGVLIATNHINSILEDTFHLKWEWTALWRCSFVVVTQLSTFSPAPAFHNTCLFHCTTMQTTRANGNGAILRSNKRIEEKSNQTTLSRPTHKMNSNIFHQAVYQVCRSIPEALNTSCFKNNPILELQDVQDTHIKFHYNSLKRTIVYNCDIL